MKGSSHKAESKIILEEGNAGEPILEHRAPNSWVPSKEAGCIGENLKEKKNASDVIEVLF